jgi:DNA-directed RNA polymerase subunit P
MYKCIDCGKEVKIDLKTAKKIICPACGYRILEKPRTKVIRKVLAK